MTDVLPNVTAVQAELDALALASDASELHGALCGWLAGGGQGGTRWLGSVLAAAQVPAVATGSALDRLQIVTAQQLADPDFTLQLLLPDAEDALEKRSAALFDWCQGFLGGFGLAAGADADMTEDGREALADLGKLAAAQPQVDGDEEDEEALAELEEFVRVAALLLYGDHVLARRHRQRLH